MLKRFVEYLRYERNYSAKTISAYVGDLEKLGVLPRRRPVDDVEHRKQRHDTRLDGGNDGPWKQCRIGKQEAQLREVAV